MLEHGEWRATAEGSGKTAGFHLSSLYSPLGWRAWCEIAAAWEAAVSKESGSAAAIKTFKNTELGETWVEEGEAPDWQRLLERREDYAIGTIPAGGLLLTAGADVQKDRIEVSVWAFGRGKEAWLIEHRVLMGDTARDAVWKALGGMLAETWTHASGAAMPLARLALDTGFATQEAYAFVRACRDPRVMAVKGVARGAALIGTPTAVDVSQAGNGTPRVSTSTSPAASRPAAVNRPGLAPRKVTVVPASTPGTPPTQPPRSASRPLGTSSAKMLRRGCELIHRAACR
jgi:phage terminase large subunit GpA-like protein